MADIDKKILKSLPRIVFFEDEHCYMGNIAPEGESTHYIPWESASAVVTIMCEPFTQSYWLVNGTYKRLLGEKELREIKRNTKWKGMRQPPKEWLNFVYTTLAPEQKQQCVIIKEQLLGEWVLKNGLASTQGTRFHIQQEEKDRKAGGAINPVTGVFQKIPLTPNPKFGSNHSLVDNLADLPDGYYPELLVFDLETRLLGQVDRAWIWTDGCERHCAFSDYKTNWEKKSKKGWIKMKHPFNHLDDGAVNKYSVQQGVYAHIMERAGFNSVYIALEWVKDYDEEQVEIQELPYLYEEMEILFEGIIKGTIQID